MSNSPKARPKPSDTASDYSADDKGKADKFSTRLEMYKTTTNLLTGLAWPVLVIALLIAFRNPIENLVQRASHIKVFQVEADIGPAQVADSLRLALDQMVSQKGFTITADSVRKLLGAFADQNKPIKSLSDGRILWVDDNPQNNVNLINAFQSLGAHVTLALNTEQAKQLLTKNSYDVIITDMNRPPDAEAGRTLIAHLRSVGNSTPVIVYALEWSQAHQNKENAIGAYKISDQTNDVYVDTIRLLRGLH